MFLLLHNFTLVDQAGSVTKERGCEEVEEKAENDFTGSIPGLLLTGKSGD